MSKVYLLITGMLMVVPGCGRQAMDKNMIFEAIELEDIVRVQQYLDSGADINVRKDYHDGPPLELGDATPLHLAIVLDNKKVVDLLIANGADVNAKAEGDITPLHAAQLFGHKEIADLLIANGADVNAKDENGLTPMDIANIDEGIDESIDEVIELLKKVLRKS